MEPNGPLEPLQFGLLVDSDGAYLGDRYAIAISSGVLYLNLARPWKELNSASRAFVIGEAGTSGWSPLPGAELEARAVASLFAHPQLVVNHSLNSPEIADDMARAQIFHFAGHADTSLQSSWPELVGIRATELLRSGVMRGSEIQIAVLSGCSTSRGTSGQFDDGNSLVRTLQAAQVPTVVASRWPVDSTASIVLMKDFYSRLLTGEEPSQALTEAEHTVRSQAQFAHPYYWAAFSVFGRG